MIASAHSNTPPWIPVSWGHAYDKGYSAGRADALDSGVSGLFEEIGRYRLALATIGRKGEPLSGFAARAIARKALDRSAMCAERWQSATSDWRNA